MANTARIPTACRTAHRRPPHDRFPSPLTAALLFLLVNLLAGAALADDLRPAAPPATHPRLAATLNPADFGAERLAIVHYRRLDEQYDQWNLWAWQEGKPGAAVAFDGSTSFGRYAVVPLPADASRVGLIVRKGDWLQKDGDRDRFIEFADGANVSEIWLLSGDEAVYADPSKIDYSVRLVAAFLDAPDRITLAATGALDERQIRGLSAATTGDDARPYRIAAVERRAEAASTRLIYDVRLDRPVAPGDTARMQLAGEGFPGLTVFARDVLDDPAFVAPDAQLGYEYSRDRTTFRTWSPVALGVELLLYDHAADAAPAKVIPLARGERGLWEATVPGDLHGQLYRYRFDSYGKQREAADIHTFAATADSAFSVVVDLDRLRPEGWGQAPVPALARPTDEVVYEIHVRDFTVADPSCPPDLRGTYLGLIHENPADGAGDVSTGVSHLKDLGVTAVHLLPIHDFTAQVGEYNWGYWTALFNVPEGNYATDPRDPTRPIVELRETIDGLHRNGIRVILDVVYNHTSSSFEHSPFDNAVPYYYFRTTPDGRLMNDAGVGNSIADERAMVRRYILDSLKFWVREYRVDGFRFDLLGTHRPETVRAICDELLAIRPDLTLYGEPWTGGGVTHFPKGAQRGLRMAVFNDHLRGAIRGDLDGTATGFATGPGGDPAALLRGVAGAIDDFAQEPLESVAYVSAHDNLTLWDKIALANPDADDAQRRAMQKLAIGVVLTSQGIAFLHGGCDFARTKDGNHNSYNAGDAVNRFDWQRKAEYRDVFEYARGLVALRRANAAFRLADDGDVRERLKVLATSPVVAFTLEGEGDWRRTVVAYNGEPGPRAVDLPPGRWAVVVDAERAGTAELRRATGRVLLPPYSMFVARLAD